MGIFLVYILKSALCLAAFYLFYRLLLSRETLHRFNRVTLLGVLLLAAVVPLIEVSTEQPTGVGQGMLTLEEWLALAEAMSEASPAPVQEARAVWPLVLLVLYSAGVLFFLGRNVCSLFRLGQLLRGMHREDIRRYVPDAPRVWLLVHGRDIAPFSWMRCIVIARRDLEEDGRPILVHELAHIRRGHSWDLLLADLCCFVQWFNPAAWLLKQELQTVHEYEADEAVLCAGVNAKEYQLLLIKKTVGTRLYSMANSLNHSKLKKRITMMTKEKSSKWACAKYLYVLPLAAVAVAVFARPEVSGVSNQLSSAKVTDLAAIVKENKVEKTPLLPPEAASAAPTVAETPASADTVIQVPEFPGGQQALKKYLDDNRRSPLVDTRRGTVIVSFVIDEEGRVTQPKVTKGIAEAFDAEAIRLVNEMPRWTPMMKDGKPVASTYVVYVDFPSTLAENFSQVEQVEPPLIVVDGKPMDEASFSKEITPDRIASVIVLKGEQAAAYGTRGQQNGVMVVVTKGAKAQNGGLKGQVAGVYEVVEQAPAFPGGPQAMRKFIKENLQYPQIAKENGIEGRVILQFVVDETGQVTDPKVVRSIDPSLDAEAIRLVSSMPRWTPGQQDGKAVAVRYTMPVTFSLGKDEAQPQKQSVWAIDGKVVPYEEVKAFSSEDIFEIRVLKGEQAVKRYGDQAKDGAIEVTTKAAAEAQEKMIVEGVVVDEKDEPIVGAIVKPVDGQGEGVVTDTKGRFYLRTSKDAEIESLFIGFQTARFKAQPKVKIILKAE
ncbi:MAG TPA: TonB family protein [Candidatus Bacteroides merdipullorum]|uniref:TonB family protein n=1 Tax=Candidatus Bacteroides merdipullorum TaxID=2838474 RepID=A0A9D2CWL4_9BACE|nr:TonB family protein [Candidatus Bacteroides merdipullorum]